jgi:hypothetical protein
MSNTSTTEGSLDPTYFIMRRLGSGSRNRKRAAGIGFLSRPDLSPGRPHTARDSVPAGLVEASAAPDAPASGLRGFRLVVDDPEIRVLMKYPRYAPSCGTSFFE